MASLASMAGVAGMASEAGVAGVASEPGAAPAVAVAARGEGSWSGSLRISPGARMIDPDRSRP